MLVKTESVDMTWVEEVKVEVEGEVVWGFWDSDGWAGLLFSLSQTVSV